MKPSDSCLAGTAVLILETGFACCAQRCRTGPSCMTGVQLAYKPQPCNSSQLNNVSIVERSALRTEENIEESRKAGLDESGLDESVLNCMYRDRTSTPRTFESEFGFLYDTTALSLMGCVSLLCLSRYHLLCHCTLPAHSLI